MRLRIAAHLLIGALGALAGCGPRGVLTGSPVLGRTRLPALELASAAPPDGDVPEETEAHPAPAPAAPPITLPPPLATPAGALHVDASVLVDSAPRAPGTVVISRLPAPHREAPTVHLVASVEEARALVGRRDPREPLELALAIAAGLVGVEAPAVTDVITWAREVGAWADLSDTTLAPGDLVVLERALDGTRPIVAVALATDERGVTELLYLARGVIRRGFVDPARPRLARDPAGLVVNTYVRHGSAHPPDGTRYLAGELATGRVRLPR